MNVSAFVHVIGVNRFAWSVWLEELSVLSVHLLFVANQAVFEKCTNRKWMCMNKPKLLIFCTTSVKQIDSTRLITGSVDREMRINVSSRLLQSISAPLLIRGIDSRIVDHIFSWSSYWFKAFQKIQSAAKGNIMRAYSHGDSFGELQGQLLTQDIMRCKFADCSSGRAWCVNLLTGREKLEQALQHEKRSETLQHHKLVVLRSWRK